MRNVTAAEVVTCLKNKSRSHSAAAIQYVMRNVTAEEVVTCPKNKSRGHSAAAI
ncbi:MAG: hypothetical protein IJ774_07095 [Selenomonadaceae bacterium]|nr:hypothetical protein [Selenomonadaceae bacterium]